MAQPIVLAMETVVVLKELRRVTEVLVVDMVTISNRTAANASMLRQNHTLPASLDPEAHRA